MTVLTGYLQAHTSPPTFSRWLKDDKLRGLRDSAPLPNVEVYRAKRGPDGQYISDHDYNQHIRTEPPYNFITRFNPGSER